ncbi:MAG: sensor histidine kinase, partial [Bacillota bacterium]
DLVGVLRHYDFDRLLKIALQSQEEISEEIQLLVPEVRIYRVTFTPLLGSDLGGDRGGVVVVLRDVTERRQVEQMRSEFIANVSHELRTPLTSISGFLETLLDGAVEDRELARHFLQIISDETRRITRLLDDLFALSNIEYRRVTPRRENVDLGDVVERVREIFLPQAQEKNIHLLNNMPHGLPPVVGDSDMLTRVLINLVDNAIKYTPEGGTVSIKGGLADAGGVFVSVTDTGIGIPADSLPRVFERLYRVDRARARGNGSGYGLGLAIVKHIVELHRGRIEVQSTPGVGSTFTVFLPLPEEQKQLQ